METPKKVLGFENQGGPAWFLDNSRRRTSPTPSIETKPAIIWKKKNCPLSKWTLTLHNRCSFFSHDPWEFPRRWGIKKKGFFGSGFLVKHVLGTHQEVPRRNTTQRLLWSCWVLSTETDSSFLSLRAAFRSAEEIIHQYWTSKKKRFHFYWAVDFFTT